MARRHKVLTFPPKYADLSTRRVNLDDGVTVTARLLEQKQLVSICNLMRLFDDTNGIDYQLRWVINKYHNTFKWTSLKTQVIAMSWSVVHAINAWINTLRPRQKGRHFKRIFLNEDIRILIEISLKFVPKGPINNIPALVQIMTWRRPGDKPLSEPIMVRLPTHICVTRPQWVNVSRFVWMPPYTTYIVYIV